MKGDPYSELYGLMREAGQPSGGSGVRLWRGTVLSAAPMTVDVAGTTQEADRLYISHRLVQGHAERLTVAGSGVSGALAISASCPNGSHDRMTIAGGTVDLSVAATQAEPVLKAGDTVLLLTEDGERFYILDKVVSCA